MANLLTIKRGTRSQIDAAASASALNVGEPYLITDEDRIAVGLSASTYEEFAKSSEAGGGSGYANSDVDAHLNTSTAGAGEVLSWNGSDYDWVAQSGGGGGDLSLDGGFANSVYTAAQTVNGGSASG